MKVCRVPFEFLEIYDDGVVNTCCPWYNNSLSIGNIYETNFDDVWNSEVAIDYRTRLLNGDYSLCNLNLCPAQKNPLLLFDKETTDYEPVMKKYPKFVNFCHDTECNLYCTICRDEIVVNSDSELELKNKRIDEVFLPLLKDAETVSLCGKGDPFASRNCKKLITAISSTYPKIRFNFVTNGVLANEKMLKTLGVVDKINSIHISPHSVTKKTYQKIVRGGRFDDVVKNIKMFSKMKKENRIYDFSLIFVVHSVNYQEMPAFVEFANKHNAQPVFWEYRQQASMSSDNYDELAIFEPTHRDHHKLIKVLQHKNFNIEKDPLHPLLRSLIEKTNSQS